MAAALDFKKEYKDLYQPKAQPAVIDVPPMAFIAVRGQGDPNTAPAYNTELNRKRFDGPAFLRLCFASFTRRRLRLRLALSVSHSHQKCSVHQCVSSFVQYKEALEILYALSYAIKMSGQAPSGYCEYVAPPLEGLWWADGEVFDGIHLKDKTALRWLSLIRQPDFVTAEVLAQAKAAAAKKLPAAALDKAALWHWTEGVCVQIMHIGPYAAQPQSIRQLAPYAQAQGYRMDLQQARPHHEMYLGGPRKTAPDKQRTVIRHPVTPIQPGRA